MSWYGGYGSYGYGGAYAGYGGGYYGGGIGSGNSFTLLVVLFVLLVIIGSTYPIGEDYG